MSIKINIMKSALTTVAAAAVLGLALTATASAQPGTTGGAIIHDAPAKGTPNLTGKWINAKPESMLTAMGSPPPLNAAGKKAYADNKAKKTAGKDPATECLMQGEPRLLFTKYPFLIMQYGKHVDFLHQANHTFLITYFGDKLDPDADPIWLGHTTAKWEGKTLVIDGAQYNTETWLDYSGLPHSDKLATEEKFTLAPDGKTIKGTVKITDPDFYSKPWIATFTLNKMPGYSLEQYSCMADHHM
jgi:hypothetical protein